MSRYKPPFRLSMGNKILRFAHAKYHYFLLFLYKINKEDLPFMYSLVFWCEFIDAVDFFGSCLCDPCHSLCVIVKVNTPSQKLQNQNVFAKNSAFVSPFYRRIFCFSLVLKSLPFPAYLKPEKGTPFGRISPKMRPLHRNTPEGIIFSLTLFDVRLSYFICHCWPFSLIISVLLDLYLVTLLKGFREISRSSLSEPFLSSGFLVLPGT